MSDEQVRWSEYSPDVLKKTCGMKTPTPLFRIINKTKRGKDMKFIKLGLMIININHINYFGKPEESESTEPYTLYMNNGDQITITENMYYEIIKYLADHNKLY